MKKTLLSILIVLISIYFTNAQEIKNLNNASIQQFEEITGTLNGEINFKEAIRFRRLVLNQNIQRDSDIQLKDIIQLDLFANTQYKAVVDKIKTDVNGTLLVRAKLVGYEYAYCFISTFEGKSFIVIEIPEKNELYMTRFNHSTNTYHLLQVDKSKLDEKEACFGEDLVTNKKATNNKSFSNNPVVLQSPTTIDTITLLVVYTPAAATWSAANEVSINNTINLMMARAELTNDNTDSLLFIELVHTQQVAYTELQSVQDLFNLRNTNDGILDTAHTLRNTYCADLVTLLESTSHTGGTAFLLNNISGSPSNGFSILRVQQSSWTYTAIHEFGHNLGCGHSSIQNVQAGPGIFPYSAGGRWVSVPSGNFCSIMSYESGTYYADNVTHTRVPYFSNPSKLYQGTATGDSVTADNARSIRTTKSVVAGYRSGCALPSQVMVSGNGGLYCDSVTLTASGGIGGTIFWQGTTSGDTSTATPSTSQTVTASGTYYFRAKNIQGWGPEGSSTVTIINNVPSQAGTISGISTVNQGQSITYTVPAIANATSYTWTLPVGATGTSRTNSITVNYSNSAVSGDITVSGNNTCGNGASATLSIIVNSLSSSNVQLTLGSCGVTDIDPVNTLLFYNTRTDATNYRIRVNGPGVSNFIHLSGNNNRFNINQIPGVQFGQSYTVDVAAFVSGTWTGYGISCTVSTATIATAVNLNLTPASCGVANIDPGSTTIFYYTRTDATNYRIRVNGPGVSNFVHLSGNNNRFNINQITGVQFGQTYAVEVAAFINGQWSNYGTSCSVSTESLAAAVNLSLTPSSCGVTNVDPGSTTIFYYTRTDATNYRIRVNGPGVSNFVHLSGNNNRFNINQITGVQFGQTYAVEVAAFIGGVWSNYGTSCTVSTATLAAAVNLGLTPASCGATNVNSVSATIFYYTRLDATNYRVRVNGPGVSNFVHLSGNNNRFNINQISGIQFSQTYAVEVAAFINGQWSNYGTACNLSTAAFTPATPLARMKSPAMENNELSSDMSVYPNPSAQDVVHIKYNRNSDQSTERIELEVFDISGKKIIKRSLSLTDGELMYDINTTRSMSAGIYIVRLIDGKMTKTEKLIIR